MQSIEELTSEQLPMAVEYAHKLCLEGELIIDDKPKSKGIWLEENEFYALAVNDLQKLDQKDPKKMIHSSVKLVTVLKTIRLVTCF